MRIKEAVRVVTVGQGVQFAHKDEMIDTEVKKAGCYEQAC